MMIDDSFRVTQKGNPLIDHIRNVAWEYSDILADYQVGATTGVLYLRLVWNFLHLFPMVS